MAYECIENKRIDLIYASYGASETLAALKCEIPVKIFKLRVGSSMLHKIYGVIDIIHLYYLMRNNKPCEIAVPSFSKIWSLFPGISVRQLEYNDRLLSRHAAISKLLDRWS